MQLGDVGQFAKKDKINNWLNLFNQRGGKDLRHLCQSGAILWLRDTSSPDFSSPHFHPRFFIPWLFHPQIFHPQLFHPRIFIPALSSPHFHPHMMMLLKWMMRLQITSRRMIRKSWETWTLAASPSRVSSAKFSVLPIPPSYYYALLKSRTTEGPRIALKFVQIFLRAIRNRIVWISY